MRRALSKKNWRIREELGDSDNLANYDFANDDDGELVDIDAELDPILLKILVILKGMTGLIDVKMAWLRIKSVKLPSMEFYLMIMVRLYEAFKEGCVTPGAVLFKHPELKGKVPESGINKHVTFHWEQTVRIWRIRCDSVNPRSGRCFKGNHEAVVNISRFITASH